MDLSNGDTLIMKSDNFVNNWIAQASGEMTQVIVFQLSADFLEFLYDHKLPDWFQKQGSTVGNSVEKVPPSPLISSFYQSLQLYVNEPSLLNEELTKLKTRELITCLINADQKGTIKQIFGYLFEPKSYEFQEIIQNNLFEDLNIENLAFLANMSLSSFKRKFSAIYGTSPNKYIISKRLEKAQNLIHTTDLSITEIALRLWIQRCQLFLKDIQKVLSYPSFRHQKIG